jgi:peptidoglycan/xylan/chitin deacetylase (PgdA/CDA1 family)
LTAWAVLGAQPQPDLVDQIVSAHRRLMVLTDAAERGPAASQATVLAVARAIYARREQALQQLEDELVELLRNAPDAGRTRVAALTDRLGGAAVTEAGDRLAFTDMLASLQDSLRSRELSDIADRVRRLRDQIEAARNQFDREAARRGVMRGESRPEWREYLRRLRSSTDPTAILQEEHAHDSDVVRGTYPGEITGRELPTGTIVLTFDDGPHPRYTEGILQVLAKARIQAMFFQVGQRLGSPRETGTTPALTPLAALTREIAAAGHIVANHSYSHRAMGRLGASEQAREMVSTNALLTAISGEPPRFFRPPYGARNAVLLERVTELRMRSIMWNIDSMDWADPIPASIVSRVVNAAKAQQRGIVLFHDIHQQSVLALPRVLDALGDAGIRIGSPGQVGSGK